MKKEEKVGSEESTLNKIRFISPSAVIIDEKTMIRDVDRKDPKFKELVDSIGRWGVLQPILLRERGDELVLVDGRQRLEGAKINKQKAIPFIVTSGKPEEVISKGLDLNEARVPMSPVQEALVLSRARKITKSNSNVKLSKILGRNPRWVSDHLSILELPKELQEALDDNTGEVTIGKIHELMRVAPKDRAQLVPVMKKANLALFRQHIEKRAAAGEIAFVGGKAKPRTKEGKEGTSHDTKVAKKGKEVLHKKVKEDAEEADIDMKTPTQVEKAAKEAEVALNSELKKNEDKQDAGEIAYQRGRLHAFLCVLNMPEKDSVKESL